VTVAMLALVGSATLVAIIATVCGGVKLAGAVYNPLDDSVPNDGLMVQMTAVFVVFAT